MTALEKPVTRKAQVRAVHGISEQLVITLYPGGEIGIRELRRPAGTEQRFSAAKLYELAVIRAAAERKHERKRRAA